MNKCHEDKEGIEGKTVDASIQTCSFKRLVTTRSLQAGSHFHGHIGKMGQNFNESSEKYRCV